MTAQAKSIIWEIFKNVAVTGALLVGSTYVLASRTDVQVQANKEEARRELAAAVSIRRAEQAVLEQRLNIYEASQKELVEAMRRLTAEVASSNKESGVSREETNRGLAVLGEQVKMLRSDFNDFRTQQRKP